MNMERGKCASGSGRWYCSQSQRRLLNCESLSMWDGKIVSRRKRRGWRERDGGGEGEKEGERERGREG